MGCTMTRWLSWIVGAGLCVGMVAGCGPKIFLAERDFNQARHDLIPPSLDQGEPLPPGAALTAAIPTPADVDNADRPPRHMTLQEAIAISLENGATVRGGTTSGQADDGMLAGQISGLVLPGNSSDRIRVLALNPAIVTASLEESLARFDAVWVSSMNWTTTDNLTQGLS